MTGEIEKIFIQAVKQPTQDLKKKQLSRFIIEVKKLRDQIDKMQETILFYDNEKKTLISLGLSKETASHYMLNVQHLDISQSYQQNQLQEKALQGYQLIQKLRKKLTHEPIVYQIGVGSKKKEKLFETTMTYDELEPMLYKKNKINVSNLDIIIFDLDKVILAMQNNDNNIDEIVTNFNKSLILLFIF